MNDYHDTGLLKLVIQEPESPSVITFVQSRAALLLLHPLLEYETKNALPRELNPRAFDKGFE